ncbi:MAG: hypothetical protein P1P93_07310 [Gammaproteobacteria bacterium]|nr:hypothetical protein [Gammaproteobacteria bacterium]
MIEIPGQNTTPIVTASSPKSNVRFNSISEEDRAMAAVERRLSPTRRRPQQSKKQIERRVSSDRRRSSFSRKA